MMECLDHAPLTTAPCGDSALHVLVVHTSRVGQCGTNIRPGPVTAEGALETRDICKIDLGEFLVEHDDVSKTEAFRVAIVTQPDVR